MAGATEATSSVAPAAAATATMPAGDTTHLMSYFRYQKHSGTILAHIVLMAIAWIVILPVGKRSPIIILMRSRRARYVANDWNFVLGEKALYLVYQSPDSRCQLSLVSWSPMLLPYYAASYTVTKLPIFMNTMCIPR